MYVFGNTIMSLQAVPIIGYDNRGGLHTNKKPAWIPDQAFQRLENGYAWRDRIKQREGIKLVGRLERIFTAASLGNSVAVSWTFNIYSTLIPAITGEPNAEINPGSVEITVGAIVFTDQGDGTLTSVTVGNSGRINYVSGDVTLTHTAVVAAATIDFGYYPSFPAMGISLREIANINDEQTIFFDTKYAYIWNGSSFQEFISGTTWAGTNSDFFWTTNYRGTNPQDRLFFATNFVNDASNPIRYTDGATWTSFSPAIDSTNFLFQARILIPYFGRLIALDTYEGATVGSAVNIYNRCRFSQVGNPIQSDAWRSDIFGKGGFLDAPTNEEIVGCTFLNNTLIVFFERTTWQLRYVGEYGLPFIWERVSSDLGSESTFSPVLFSQNVLAIGDKAIISADSNSLSRIDLDIPDQIFSFQNVENGVKRVHGIRNYQKELVYWCYADASTQAAPGVNTIFPNKVLVYNYRNNTWAIFRDSVTCFGTLQLSTNITWDSQVVYWDDENVTWDDTDTQAKFPDIVSGNQQGYIHFYAYTGSQGTGFPTIDQESLSIRAISVSSNVVSLTIENHNLANGEIILLTGLKFINSATFVPVSTDLNNNIYRVEVVDVDTINISKWDFVGKNYYYNFSFTPDLATSTYVGGGNVILYPKPNIQTKDFNPYQTQGLQSRLSYLDFQADVTVTKVGFITGATRANPCVITSASHGLITGQKIIISGVQGMTQLNGTTIYTVTVISSNSFSINIDSLNFSSYVSDGSWTQVIGDLSIEIFLNSSPALSGNLLINNTVLSTTNPAPFYGPVSQYLWQRFYANCTGQYMNFLLTYDDDLMNSLITHQKLLTLNAMILWLKPGSRNVF